MELTNQNVDVDTNKTSAIVTKLVDHIDHGHTLWLESFYNCPGLGPFLKFKGTDCVGTLCTNKKNVFPS
jgi:hypothetical protein